MMDRQILGHLVKNEKYARAVIAFLRPEYFFEPAERTLFELIATYSAKYGTFPTKEALFIDLDAKSDDINENSYKQCWEIISEIQTEDATDLKYLLDKTEEFCKERALEIAVRTAIDALDKNNTKVSRGSLPTLLQDALQVSFDVHVGHDFLEDTDARFDSYHEKHKRIGFDIDQLNLITKGGLKPKTLNCLMATTGVGKTLVMCHMAAANMMEGKNVLYITLEMSQEQIAQRIDQNLLDLTTDELMALEREEYKTKVAEVRRQTKGKLIIKEYPTSTAGANHFRALLNEVKLKKKFIPDIIYVDYLNLCNSIRVKGDAGSVGSYTIVKWIAEELRGLAVENNLPIMTATQGNRAAIGSNDIGLENTSESIGLPQTVDLMLGLMADDQMIQMNQMVVKQLKNRYADPNNPNRFYIGVDRAKMRLFNKRKVDVDDEVPDDFPVMDNTDVGQDMGDYKADVHSFF